MPEEALIENCSPVLAGLKTANLFSICCTDREAVRRDLREMNAIFVRKGLRAIPLGQTGTHTLIYIYRPNRLQEDLRDERAREILKERGYHPEDAGSCVIRMIRKLREAPGEFPHEIGLFLGYPAEDVEGYIRDRGKHPKLSGFWQVYSDPQYAQCTFSRYRRCMSCYDKAYECGFSIDRLTVPAAGRKTKAGTFPSA